MSNLLKVSEQTTIGSLYQKGWSLRRIATELGVNRRTVRRYAAKCTIVTAGSENSEGGGEGSKCTIVTPGSESSERDPESSKCTIVTAGSEGGKGQRVGSLRPGQTSLCERFSGIIEGKLELGLSAQRIWQDLVGEQGFKGSYQSVKRFVRQCKARQPKRVWRMECRPGEEMQVDFGLGAWIEEPNGRKRRSWVLRAVLGYSRKGYSEAVFRQDTESFVRVVENAFRHYGGVPLLLNLDNLKAAVLKADWFDPELNPKFRDFCRHYGVHVMPCRPQTPEHKGKVERGVAYVRQNALKGRRFASLAEENGFLAQWEATIADRRLHGTTCKQVAASFELEERAHLQPLPTSLFACYQEARRTVGRDSFVEVQRAFYEVPPEYIGRQVWVRWESRCVRILNDRMEQVQMHTRIEPGRFSRVLGVGGLSAPVLASCRWWVERAKLIGDQCGRWAQEALEARGPEALRAIMGLCRLSERHSAGAIEAACGKARQGAVRRLRDLRRLLLPGVPTQTQFAFAQEHPLIRDLKTYSQFLANHHDTPHHHDPPSEPQKPGPNVASLGAA
jgi:transposase